MIYDSALALARFHFRVHRERLIIESNTMTTRFYYITRLDIMGLDLEVKLTA